jgi:Protein of unknown function (DUF3379)
VIDCAHYRRAVLADPHAESPELAEHLAHCQECPAYRERLLRFEGRLTRALRIDAQVSQTRAQVPRLRVRRNGWLAMAASLVAALLVGTLWLGAPHASLAADVVTHMAGEPEAWARTDVAVPAADLAPVLAEAHIRLRPDAGMVSYAQSCLFRGHHVPHLVVQTDMGPVTVMVLVHENVAAARMFDEGGYRGTIVPVPGHGSIAVLVKGEQGDLAQVESVAARVKDAIVWTG